MADDFQVKQGVNTQSSSGAYGLTGAAIGALGGGLGAHYITKPKYGSHEDIIKEAKDSTDFSSKIEKAEGEEKKFLQAAKDVADEKNNAEKTWNEEFKAYQEAHKDGIPVEEGEEYNKYKELKTAQEKAEADLAAKKQQLIDEQVKLIKENGNAIDPRYKAGLEKTISNNETELAKWKRDRKALATEADNVVSGKKTYTYKHPVNGKSVTFNFDKLLEAEETFNKDIKSGKKKMYFEVPNKRDNGTHIELRIPKTQEEISAAKKYFYQEYNSILRGLFSDSAALKDGNLFNAIVEDAKTVQLNKVRMNLYRTSSVDALNAQTNQLVDAYVKAENELAGTTKFDLVKWAENKGKKLDTAAGKSNLTSLAEAYKDPNTTAKAKENIKKQIATNFEFLMDADKQALEKERKIQDIYRRLIEAKNTGTISVHWTKPHITIDMPKDDVVLNAFKQELADAEIKNKAEYDKKKATFEKANPGKKYPKKYQPLKTFEEYVTEAEKMKLSDVKSKISTLEADIKKVENIIEKYDTHKQATENFRVAEQRIQETIGKDANGKFYTVKNVGGKYQLVDSTGKVYTPTATPREILRENVELLESDKKIAQYEQKIARDKAKLTGNTALTEEEILEKAKNAVKATEYEAETRAVQEAKSQADAVYEKLPKQARNETEQLADFAKSKGVKDKEEFLNNKVKEKAEKFGKDFEAQFKRKYGFAEHFSWKAAGVAAAGALVLGGLFSMFAPKND